MLKISKMKFKRNAKQRNLVYRQILDKIINIIASLFLFYERWRREKTNKDYLGLENEKKTKNENL